jgi:hypothetical protein
MNRFGYPKQSFLSRIGRIGVLKAHLDCIRMQQWHIQIDELPPSRLVLGIADSDQQAGSGIERIHRQGWGVYGKDLQREF